MKTPMQDFKELVRIKDECANLRFALQELGKQNNVFWKVKFDIDKAIERMGSVIYSMIEAEERAKQEGWNK